MMKYALTAAAGLAFAATAQAGTGFGFDWESFDNAGGTTTIGEPITITGGDAGAAGQTGVTTTANSSTTIVADWWYETQDTGDFDFGFYTVNGNDVQFVINDDALANGGSISGTVEFDVNAGDTFGFGVETMDGAFGPATLTLHNVVPTPGALALFGVAGLAAARRRR